MKHLKNVVSSFLLALFLGCSALTVVSVPVHATDLSSVVDNIQGSKTQVIEAATKDKVTGLSKQTMDIVGVIVMTIVTISGIWCAIKFVGAGENPQAKATLKTVIVFHVLGLVFLASYFGFVSFSFRNLNLFK